MDRFGRFAFGRGWRILLLLAVLSLIPLAVAAADYIGPKNRTTTKTVTQTLRVCYYGGSQYCSCVVDGGECNAGTVKCGDWRGGCSEYPQSKDVTTTLPNATSSGNYVCGTPGSNGWCKGGARVDFTANEPVSGYIIQYLEGNLGIYCNPADAATVSCSWTPPQGNNTVQYWAHSSFGDTSTSATIPVAVKVDSGLPTAGVGVGTPNGANGWFISPVTATATGTDGTSGIGSLNVNLDGGAWQANGTAFSNQGAHTVQGLARDNAGNQATSGTVTFSLDSVKPAISTTIPTPDGSNGWFKSGPVSLAVSGTDATSGMSAAQIQIGAGAWQNNSASITGDGSYTVNFRTVDLAGNVNSTSSTVRLDQTAPTGTVGLTGTLGLNGWYVSKPTALVNGSDATSGVASSQVNLDGGAWSGTLSIPDGTHAVAGQVSDNAGNSANAASVSVKVDTVAPTLNPGYSAADGANGWYKTPVTLSVSGTDATSGMAGSEIQVDGGAWQANSATLSSDGTHSVIFRTRDNAGNVSSQSLTFKVDRAGPAVSITPTGTSGLAGWFVSTVNVTAAATDPTSGIATKDYRIDGGVWQTLGAGGFTLTDGVHSIDVRSTDNAGNSSTMTRNISVDTIAPTLNKVVPAPDGLASWYVSPINLSVAGADAGSGLAASEIQIDAGTWTANSAKVMTDGNHTLAFRSRDIAGNTTTQTVSVKVDLAGPSVAIVPTGTSGAGFWYISNVSVAVSASDAVSGMASSEYRVDGGSWSAMGPSFMLTDGVHSVDIRSYDNAGNSSTATRSISVDTTAPIVLKTIPTPDGKGGWYVTNPNLAVSGTDATSGVNTSDIQIDGGSWTQGKVTATGDGSHNLTFRVVDFAGNTSTSTASIKIDTTSPVAIYTVPTGTPGTGGWYTSTTVTGSVAVTDATSGLADVEYKIDGGAWTAGASATLSSDGVHTVDFSYSDNAGNTATQTRTIKVDSTKPTILPISTGTKGADDWWTTRVVVDPNPIDVTSGVSKTEIQVNGGAWQPVDTVTLTNDGRYQVGVRVTDNAGNVLTDTLDYKVDTTRPSCAISQPPIDKMLTGKINMTGSCTDAGSGIDTITISVDGGKTWTDLPNTGGNWTFTWDTVLYPGPVIIKGTDHATNEETTTHTYKVINELPRADLQDQWYIWNAGTLKIWVGDLPVTRVSISIADWKNRWPAREWTYDNLKEVPPEIKWDRKFADGTLAPIGDYAVRVTVWDSYNRTGKDEGKILIPSGPTPTAVVSTEMPTATRTATRTPTPTSTRVAVVTPLPTLTAAPTKVAESHIEQPKLHFLPILALLVFLGLLCGLGLSASRDPRPAAIHRLAATLRQLTALQKGR